MIRLFRSHVPASLLLLGILEVLWLLAACEMAWQFRIYQAGIGYRPAATRVPELLTFASVVFVILLGVGYYRIECFRSLRISLVRLVASLFFALLALSVIFFLYPDVVVWRSVLLYALLAAFAGLVTLRALFQNFGGLDRFKRNILLMGAGDRAAIIHALAARPDSSFTVVRSIRMTESECQDTTADDRESIGSLVEMVAGCAVDEVVLAPDERRGALPIGSLIEVKLAGTRVSDLTDFIERETGRVDIQVLNPSWIIFGEGFVASHRISVIIKRLFDLLASGLLLAITAPALLITAIAIKLTSRGPVLYRQERVGLGGVPFNVLKFRSMRTDAEAQGAPQWATKRDPRVTSVGRLIRATRIDEIPQIFNVFRGEMSFVGPRPERPFFVDQLTRQIPFFAERHAVKPGITGWAQINYPYGASVEDARAKLEYDLYYVKNYSIFLDLMILIQTVRVVLWQDGVR